MAPPARGTERSAGRDEVARLLRACRVHGDPAARERLVALHMPLVESIARRHDAGGDDLEDLVQVGAIGLMQAIDRYEPARGTAFAAYASPTIAGEIKRHLRDRTGAVHVPRGLRELGTRARRSQDELTARLGREPTTAELASALQSDESELLSALAAHDARSPLGLGDATAGGAGAQDSTAERLDLAGALSVLDDDERRIVRMRFADGAPNDEIARAVGVSTRQLSRRLQRALAKLKAALEQVPDRPLAAEGHERRIDGMASQAGAEASSEAEARTSQQAAKHSGRLLLRMPQSLHAELAQRADREGVSLNGLIVGLLAGGIGWERQDGAPAANGESPAAGPARPGVPRGAIVANIVVVAAAVVVAIALLVMAVMHG